MRFNVPLLATTVVAAAAIAMTTLTACGADGDAFSPVREYSINLRAEEQGEEYTYVAEDALDLRVGDRVTIEMSNAGALIHDLQVIHPDGQPIAIAPPFAGGSSLTLVVDFEEAGIYRLNCLVDNHLTEHGMQALIEVKAADA
jgi:uncharacterized cupredoxin-like copper-binding protein